MNQTSPSDYAHQLRSLMQQVGVSSFKALSQRAGVSEWQVRQLRTGHIAQMRVAVLQQLSQALQISLGELMTLFSEESEATDLSLAPVPQAAEAIVLTSPSTGSSTSSSTNPLTGSLTNSATSPDREAELLATIDQLRQEYQRSQAQLATQREQLWQEFQLSSLNTLESWLLQFPTAAYAAQHNPQVPATRLLPLMRPIEQLLKSWKVEAIAPVGAELPYDPQVHQLKEGTAKPGDRVQVRNPGYRQGEKLLYRATVSPLARS